MTRDKNFKKLVRARMKRTGECFAAARAQLVTKDSSTSLPRHDFPATPTTPPLELRGTPDALLERILRRFGEERSVYTDEVMDWAEGNLAEALHRRAVASPLRHLSSVSFDLDVDGDGLTIHPDSGVPEGDALMDRALKVGARFGAINGKLWRSGLSHATIVDPSGTGRRAIVKFLRLTGAKVRVTVWQEPIAASFSSTITDRGT